MNLLFEAVELSLLFVYWLTNVHEYKALRAKREVDYAIKRFELAIKRNSQDYMLAKKRLMELESKLEGITDHLKVVFANVCGKKALESHFRGERTRFSQRDVISWLSADDLELLDQSKLLQTQQAVAQTNLACLANIDRSLQASYQRSQNLLASLNLRSTVGDVVKLLGDVNLSGIGDLTDRLAEDVDKLLNQQTEVRDMLDLGGNDVESALSGLSTQKESGYGELLDSLLASTGLMNTVIEVGGDEKLRSLVS